jgi:hypothetical protein
VALVFQFVFLVISRDPARYRPLIAVSIFEKLVFAVPVAFFYLNGRVSTSIFAAGMIDAALCVLFLISFIKTSPHRNETLASEYIN